MHTVREYRGADSTGQLYYAHDTGQHTYTQTLRLKGSLPVNCLEPWTAKTVAQSHHQELAPSLLSDSQTTSKIEILKSCCSKKIHLYQHQRFQIEKSLVDNVGICFSSILP